APRGLDIPLPQPPPPNQPEQRTPPNQVVLALEEGAITVNKNPVTLEDLEARLRDISQARSDKTIFVRATGTVPYGRVVQAMDLAKAAGVERIGIISDKMIEEAGGPGGGQRQPPGGWGGGMPPDEPIRRVLSFSSSLAPKRPAIVQAGGRAVGI